MESKIKLEKILYLIICKQVFQLKTLPEAIEEAKNEMEESGEEIQFCYSPTYISRRLQKYNAKNFRITLLKRLALHEKSITDEILEII